MRKVYVVQFGSKSGNTGSAVEFTVSAGPEQARQYGAAEEAFARGDCHWLRSVANANFSLGDEEYICRSFDVETLPTGKFVIICNAELKSTGRRPEGARR